LVLFRPDISVIGKKPVRICTVVGFYSAFGHFLLTARLAYSQSMPRPSADAASEPKRGELALIRQIRGRAGKSASATLRLGIGDDCALLRPRPGYELAVTTDLTVCGRHFRLDWHTPESVGHRALARGLSDLAAMGATPVAAFLSLGLPRDLATPLATLKGRRTGANSWVTRFFDGLLALADACKTPLAGGDLSETAVPLADIVLIGSVPRVKALLRSTARPGDLLYVTGTLGGGAASLQHLDRLAKQYKGKSSGLNGLSPAQIPNELKALLARHLYPQPRLAQGMRLRSKGLASAAMDMSDGLSSDLAHICEESHVAAEIVPTLLPIHPGANLEYALHGGDDYELLFTAKPGVRMPRKIAGVPITRIGRILRARAGQPAVTLLTPEGPEPLKAEGWEHFV
jgi:thiamine-monophosphate kinase